MFRARFLSTTLIRNFQNNYHHTIFNGNGYPLSEYNSKRVSLLDEIARLFLKSSRRHYYSVRPRYNDPKNYLSESFSKGKMLHTNLSVDYFFRNLFLKHDWDIAMIISESGGILSFLNSIIDKKRFLSRKIIVLNSYDAIKQLHRNQTEIRNVNEHQNEFYKTLLSVSVDNQTVIHTFSLPAVQHNHHMMLFIKKVICSTDNNNDSYSTNNNLDDLPIYETSDITNEITNATSKEPLFQMTGSMYIYRQSFSNNVNPLVIGEFPFTNPDEDIEGLNHDFRKLLRIFSTTFCRALAFEGVKKIKNLDVDLSKYQKWLPDEQNKNTDKLLKYLYNLQDANFVIELDN